ncbi:hypothetical protein, partial [Streptomyces sp. NRRL WC-3549]|uniref:hypothetical protein n=1 Tax=Streptomyces sp. NRRL WC-3549 TaxID=1463925 RepID=UPI000B3198AD
MCIRDSLSVLLRRDGVGPVGGGRRLGPGQLVDLLRPGRGSVGGAGQLGRDRPGRCLCAVRCPVLRAFLRLGRCRRG